MSRIRIEYEESIFYQQITDWGTGIFDDDSSLCKYSFMDIYTKPKFSTNSVCKSNGNWHGEIHDNEPIEKNPYFKYAAYCRNHSDNNEWKLF